MNRKLLETVADIAYTAGEVGYFSGDSRADISEFIHWAKMFQEEHKRTNWDEVDYLLTVQEFVEDKLKAAMEELPVR